MRNKRTLLFAFLIGSVLTGPMRTHAQNGNYTVDTTQSELRFKVSHMGPFKVKGFFSEYSGQINFEQGRFINLNAEVVVESINTDNEERDRILKTEPYFNIEYFPLISFASDSLEEVDNEDLLSGTLTIKETSRELNIPVSIDYDPDSDQLIIEGESRISRKEFNLVFGSMNGLIGDKVDIQIRIIANKN